MVAQVHDPFGLWPINGDCQKRRPSSVTQHGGLCNMGTIIYSSAHFTQINQPSEDSNNFQSLLTWNTQFLCIQFFLDTSTPRAFLNIPGWAILLLLELKDFCSHSTTSYPIFRFSNVGLSFLVSCFNYLDSCFFRNRGNWRSREIELCRIAASLNKFRFLFRRQL